MLLVLGTSLALATDAPPPPVPARLVASVVSVAAGQTFDVGVVLDVPAGWHVYWENPGDSGIATWVELTAAGATVGPLRFPGPQRFDLPGGLVNLGYGAPVALVQSVTAPATLDPAAPLALHAEVGWLLCHEACIPGRAALDLALPVSATPGDNSHALDAWMPLLPSPFAEAGGVVTAIPAGSALSMRRGRIEAFYPRTGPPVVPQAKTRKGGLVVSPTEAVEGVLRVLTARGPRYYTLTLGDSP